MSDKMTILNEAQQIGDELHIDLWYPDLPSDKSFPSLPGDLKDVRCFVIGLMDVRAADNIRVSYDKDRDGWKIEQASTFKWAADDKVCDPDWQEVAFIQAWARQKDDSEFD